MKERGKQTLLNLTPGREKNSLFKLAGGHSSARLEPQIVDLAVAGSNPVDHPIYCVGRFLK